MPCGKPNTRQIQLGTQTLSYELHRSARRRKTITIEVRGGALRVLSPTRTPLASIEAFLHSRAEWIHERLERTESTGLRSQLRVGGVLPILGRPIRVEQGLWPDRPFVMQGDFVTDPDPFIAILPDDPNLNDYAVRWFRERAREVIHDLVGQWEPPVDAYAKRIRIAQQKTRWGSASQSGTLSFNWQLIFASIEIVEYVVVHELCHLKRPDHSAEYWSLVARHLPDYAERRAWLKQHGDSLSW